MPATVVTLEPASNSDAADLAELRSLAMRESLERVGHFDLERARAQLLRNFEPRFTRHICESGKKVGFVVLRPSRFGLLLDHLCVHPLHQGRGIGSAVLTMVQNEADQDVASVKQRGRSCWSG